ncbi:lantibiotic dehydratase family protein [Aquimarina gracilis]|uniref:Lantibiotic dehydratase family protein n=1 Tax=Aquimarina gracilis TaxID=874422 RepID=A0ABU6A0D1_9FLAO|nr:lantibiotic dehydratase family protein [Aquimarina gracilis]MEB3347556.1 lantibiotic dehydratase family protein [Aquimarina gracilis]
MNSKPHSILEKYILRTPILSSEVLGDISSEKIKEICSDPMVSEAIFLASPELHAEMQKFLTDADYDNPKLELSLLKYISRMSYRCTPFGLFAGISVGVLNGKTNIQLNETNKYKRTTRLDMNYLCSLVQELENINEIRNNLVYFPNNSLYKIGSKYRYVEYAYKNAVRHHYMIAIDASLYIGKVLQLAEKGAKIKDLAEAIVGPEISFADAQNFINNLIDNQILLSSISPTVSGGDYLNHISENTGVTWLEEIKRLVNQLDQTVSHKSLAPYHEIVTFLRQFEIPFNKKFLFQTDLVATTKSNELDASVAKDIQKGISVLNKLAARNKKQKLERFKKAFYKRYEDEEVPLSIALDVEAGIGYDQNHKGTFDVCPLIDDLRLSGAQKDNSNTSFYRYDMGQAATLIHKKFVEAKANDRYEVAFKDMDLADLKENWKDLPSTFPIMCSVLEDNNATPTIAIHDTGGPSASYLLGRFSHTESEIKEVLNEIVKKEEKEDRILAEIVHLPEARTGNILYRDNLRKHEIAYLAQSNLPIEQQIHISDLYISIQNDTIILRSKKLNKFVEPRMANAHNYEDTPVPIYQFLGDMQTQNLCSTINFDWGPNLYDETFYPRVRYKNVILSAARWRIKEKDLKQIKDQASLHKWQEEFNIPSIFLLTDYDNELLINLENGISREMFLAEIKNKKSILLKENLYNEFDSAVKKGKQSYNNEFIFSLYQ